MSIPWHVVKIEDGKVVLSERHPIWAGERRGKNSIFTTNVAMTVHKAREVAMKLLKKAGELERQEMIKAERIKG